MRTKRNYLLSFLTTGAIIGVLFSWSCKKDHPVEIPTLGNLIISDIIASSAVITGSIEYDGGTALIDLGIVWNTTGNPSLESHEGKSSASLNEGIFTITLTELSPGTDYYVRGYATNSEGTAYSDQFMFTTPGEPCPDMPTFTDPRDGTVYNTVLIGDQCWLKENLKYLPEVSPSSAGSDTEPHYYVYDYQGTDISEAVNTDIYNNYGVLYNWPAAMNGAGSSSANPSGVQGVCPAGWHLPSDGEWTELVDYVVSQGYPNEWNNPNGAGNALKSCRQVYSPLGGECATSEHPRWDSHSSHYGTDQSGFSALPGGYRRYNGLFDSIGDYGVWWSSTEYSSTNAWLRYMYYDGGCVCGGYNYKEFGFSVRCVRD